MFSFLKSEPPLFFACDIATSTVKMIAFRFSRKNKEAVLVNHRIVDVADPSTDAGSFTSALKEVAHFIDETSRKEGEPASRVLISLPHRMVTSAMRIFRFERPAPESSISPDELAVVWKRVTDSVGEAMKEDGSARDFAAFPPELEDVTIDGYSLPGNFAARGREIGVAVLASKWPQEFSRAFESFRPALGGAHVQCLPRIALIRDYFRFREGKEASGVFLDIGAEVVALAVFMRGNIQGSRLFPFGGADITRAIQKEFKIGYKDAEILKRSWSAGTASEEVATRLIGITKRMIDFWKGQWMAALEEISHEAVIMPNFYLSGGGGQLPIITTALSDPEWLSHFSSGSLGEVSIFFPGSKEGKYFPNWPFKTSGDAVLFSLVFRIIQRDIA